MVQQLLVIQGIHIVDASLSRRRTTLGRTSGRVIKPMQRPVPYNTQHSQERERDIYSRGRIRTCDPSKRAVARPRLRPRGHQQFSGRYKALISFLMCFL